MPNPDPDLPPNELWVEITQTPRPHRVVDFPRINPITGKPMGKVAIWPLTQEESMLCQKAAHVFVREQLKETPKEGQTVQAYEDLYRNESANQVLFLACRRPESLKWPAFPSPGEIRKKLLADEIGVLMNHYNTVRAQLGPIVAEMTVDELDQWTARLMEGGAEYFLDLLTSGAKTSLIEHLVSQLRSFVTGTTLPGAPPANTSEPSNPKSSPSDPSPSDVDAGTMTLT